MLGWKEQREGQLPTISSPSVAANSLTARKILICKGERSEVHFTLANQNSYSLYMVVVWGRNPTKTRLLRRVSSCFNIKRSNSSAVFALELRREPTIQAGLRLFFYDFLGLKKDIEKTPLKMIECKRPIQHPTPLERSLFRI